MRSLLILLLYFMSTPLVFAERIVVASELYPGYVNEDKTGMYLDILSQAYPEADIELIITTYERAVRLVVNKKADLWLGAYFNEHKDALYPRYHFDHDRLAAVYLIDSIQNNELHSIVDKKAAWVSGYNFEKYFEFNQEVYLVADIETGFRMLEAQRVEIFIDDLVEIKNSPAFNKSMATKVLKKIALYPAFAKTDRGIKLREQWDTNLKTIIENGKLRAIFDLDPMSEYPYREMDYPDGNKAK